MLLALIDWTTQEEEKTARNLEHENLVGEQAGIYHRTDDEGRKFNESFDKDVSRLPT
jgi:hypothetical protein